MNKSDLIDALAANSGMTKADSKRMLDAFIGATSSALKKGDKLTLVGFGTFSILKKGPREGRNPSTGAKMKLPAKNFVKFKPSAELAKNVNSK
jgi:DNA-binding protein HU-beta